MKAALFLLCLLPFKSQAGLKWESTRETVPYQQGVGVYRGAFAFKNTGKTPVTITDIKKGCACCTIGRVKKRDYAPGESGRVEMAIDLRGKEAPVIKPVVVEVSGGDTPTTLILEVTTPRNAVVKIPRAVPGIRK
ncbi:MAG: hypothetical protein RL088_1292 [Verrucomicrobiota bacterium]|jgi:hypothetical protein